MPYNATEGWEEYQLTNSTDVVGLIQYAQTAAPIAEITLIAVFVISFLMLKRYDSEKALTASLFISTITALLLMLMNLLNSVWFYAALILFAFSVMLLQKNSN